jgi:hypothetical protein
MFMHSSYHKDLLQECSNPGRRITARLNYVRRRLMSVWNFLHVTHLSTTILRGLLEFWKICASLTYGVMGNSFIQT